MYTGSKAGGILGCWIWHNICTHQAPSGDSDIANKITRKNWSFSFLSVFSGCWENLRAIIPPNNDLRFAIPYPWDSRIYLEDFWTLEGNFSTVVESSASCLIDQRPGAHPPWTEDFLTTTAFPNPPQPSPFSGHDANHCSFQSFFSPFRSFHLSSPPHGHSPHRLTFPFCKTLGHSFSGCPLHEAFIIPRSIAQFSFAQGGDWTIMRVMLVLIKLPSLYTESPESPWPEALGSQGLLWMTFTIWTGSNSIFGCRQHAVGDLEGQWEEQCPQSIASGLQQILHAEDRTPRY